MPDLTPSVRVEGILSGADITPATRLEYFLSKAANEIPKPSGESDAGKVLTVKADGTYSYAAKPTASGKDSFSFSIVDTDGDSIPSTPRVAYRPSDLNMIGQIRPFRTTIYSRL